MATDLLMSALSEAVKNSTADQTEIVAERVRQGSSRYATSQIHQTTVLDETRVWVRAARGKSVGHASGNHVSTEAFKQLVEQAVQVAGRQSPSPQFHSFAEAEPLPETVGHDQATVEMDSNARADAIQEIIARAGDRNWTVSGTYLTEGRQTWVLNSLGVRSEASSSIAYLRALMDSGAGTGYAASWSARARDLDPVECARSAMERCELNQEQREIPPGEYEAVFDDLCVAEGLLYLSRHGFNGQSFQDGTSFLSDRLDRRVTGQKVTVWDDATDPRSLPVRADYEGLPKRRLPLIADGIAQGIAYDSYTAWRADGRSTGHAGHPDYRDYGPTPSNLFMEGGDATREEMIRATKKGLLVTRFHYTHCPDPKRVVMTGTTRDGTFLIENGEIVGAVRNMRLTQSIPELFEGIELLGKPRLCQDWWCSNGMGSLCYVCPPIKVSRAVFSSGTLF